MQSAGNIMATVFWDDNEQGVLLITTVHYCGVLIETSEEHFKTKKGLRKKVLLSHGGRMVRYRKKKNYLIPKMYLYSIRLIRHYGSFQNKPL